MALHPAAFLPSACPDKLVLICPMIFILRMSWLSSSYFLQLVSFRRGFHEYLCCDEHRTQAALCHAWWELDGCNCWRNIQLYCCAHLLRSCACILIWILLVINCPAQRFMGTAVFLTTEVQVFVAFFHCSEPLESPQPDKLHKVRFLLDHVQTQCNCLWQPRQFISIDERMIKFKGHHSMKVYMQNKPVKWGFNLSESVPLATVTTGTLRIILASKQQLGLVTSSTIPYCFYWVTYSSVDTGCLLITIIHHLL